MAMSTRFASPGKGTRRWLAGTTAAALVLLGTPILTIAPVSAVAVDGFNIDGDTVSPAEDWNTIYTGSTPPVAMSLPDIPGDKLDRVLSSTVDNDSTPSGTLDSTTFGSANKEDPPGGKQWPSWNYTDTTNATGKSDFGFVATYSWRKATNDNLYLAFAFDRGFGTGTASYVFELNQVKQDGLDPNPVRTSGDLRIRVEDQGNGTITAAEVEIWDGATDTWSSQGAPSSNDYKIQSNSGIDPIPGDIPLTDIPNWWDSTNATDGFQKDTFIEGVFNLTEFGGGSLSCPSSGFTAFNARSITGNSDKNLVDYIQAQDINIPSNCSAILIKKYAGSSASEDNLLGGATFSIKPDPRPEAAPGETQCTPTGTVTGGITVKDNSDCDVDPADGVIKIAPALADTYTIAEVEAPPGYIGEVGTKSFEALEFETNPTTTTATFVNDLGTARWFKVDADNSNALLGGATFTVTATGGDAAAAPWDYDTNPLTVLDNTGQPGYQGLDTDITAGEFTITGLPTGTYEVEESDAPLGYELLDGVIGTFEISDTTTQLVDVPGNEENQFRNERLLGHLGVIKYAADGTTALGGATFELFKKGTPDVSMGTCTTRSTSDATLGAKGTCYISALDEPGSLAWGETYYWVEISPPAGYNISTTPQSADVELTAAEVEAQDVSDVSTIDTTDYKNDQTEVTTQAQGEQGDASGYTLSLPTTTKLFDTANITGIHDPNTTDGIAIGTIRYYLYQGESPVCLSTTVGQGGLVFVSDSYPVTAAGAQTMSGSDGYVPIEAGTYYWHARFVSNYTDADEQILGGSETCGAASERVVVNPATPGISTEATPDGVIPGDADGHDTAKLTGITPDATGTVTFKVYANDTCSAALDTFSIDLETARNSEVPGEQAEFVFDEDAQVWYVVVQSNWQGNGDYTATVPGAYYWSATYSGDDNNVGPVTEGCYAQGTDDYDNWVATEKWVVQAQPSIVTDASDGQFVDGSTSVVLSDSVTVKGLAANATGTVEFTLYGPFATESALRASIVEGVCTSNPVTPAETDVTSVELPGDNEALADVTPGSASITVTQAGFYAWQAVYVPAEGDTLDLTATHDCGDTTTMDEVSQVNPSQPTIVTTATTDLVLAAGSTATVPASDSATLDNLTAAATGSVVFQLYGPVSGTPATTSCVATGEGANLIFTSTVPITEEPGLDGAVTVNSETFAISAPGTYLWVATYVPGEGEVNNLGVAGTCNDPGETTVVKRIGIPGLDKSSPNEAGTTFNPSGSVAAGSTINYTITLKNTGDLPVTSDLVDTLPAGLSNPRDFTKDGVAAPPTTIAGQVLTWAKVTVNGGQTVLVNFNVTVSATVDPGTFIEFPNTATWANLTDKTLHRLVGPGIEIKPTLSKTSDPVTGTEVKVGDVITYTVKVGNDGNVALTGDLVDTLPGGIEVVGNYTRDDGGKAEPDKATSETLVWNAVTVQPGQTVTFTYDVKVLDAALDLDALVNTAEWLGLKAGTSHTVLVPELPQTGGSGADPMVTIGWAGALLTLGLMFLLMGRRREIDES